MELNLAALNELSLSLRVEIEENCQRKPLTQSERAVQQRLLLEIIRRQAQPGTRTDLTTCETRFSPVTDRATAVVGRLYGESHKTVERRQDILAAAEAEPAVFGDLLQQLDGTSVGRAPSVGRVHVLLRIRRATIALANRTEHGCTANDLVALAELGYRAGLIYADPAYHDGLGTWGPHRHYSTMSVEEIAALPVSALAADDCVLFLWVQSVQLALGSHVTVMRAWGFEPVTLGFSWPKRNPSGEGYHCGLGNWTRHGTEVCILGVKGNPKRLAKDVHEIVDAPIGAHSAKPAEVHKRIERLVAGPYLELFARERVPGWTVWGNELAPDQMHPISEAAE